MAKKKSEKKTENSANEKRSSNVTVNYDGIAKQLMNNMQDDNIIKFIGALFSKKYTSESKIVRLCTETYDEKTKQRRSDFYLKVDDDFYNIEIQSTEDKIMALRIFEYGFRGAVLHGNRSIDDDTIELNFPKPMVIYLRKGEDPHKELKVLLNLPEQDKPIEYHAEVRYIDDYELDDLIEQHCYPLIPFFPMRFEDELYSPHDEETENRINDEIRRLIANLRKKMESGELIYADYDYIVEALKEIYSGMISKSKESKTLVNEKEAEITMDTILDRTFTFFDIYDYRDKARAEGETIGDRKRTINVVLTMLKKNMDVELIAECVGLDRTQVEKIKQEYGSGKIDHTDKPKR